MNVRLQRRKNKLFSSSNFRQLLHLLDSASSNGSRRWQSTAAKVAATAASSGRHEPDHPNMVTEVPGPRSQQLMR